MTNVLYEVADQVATITINRPEALNALNGDVLKDLGSAVAQAAADRVRAVLVTGAGEKAFVAGADIAAMATMTPREAQAFSELGNTVFRQVERLPMPTIAVVNGFALGGGCELALSCDVRLASVKAVFGQPEVGLGITPGFGGTQRLARTVGIGLAKEIIFSGRNIDATRALAIGLVNSVYEPAELMPAALKMAAGIAAKAPVAVRAAKAAINLGIQTDIDSGIALEAAYFATCFATEDQTEGMTAFVEKRKPAPFQDK
ncbi:MAG: enoyl-CoA hydratase/isomerase family protein [Propionibacteriaceae bacterium]|jgi:enoyl-CoA hydratase|nr:enoyl-CoA hydratase/isomerase family protein [Propionibacteriaceae bacterium]